MKGALS